MAVDSVREDLVRLVEREFADASLLRAEYELMLFASQDDELGKAVTAQEGTRRRCRCSSNGTGRCKAANGSCAHSD